MCWFPNIAAQMSVDECVDTKVSTCQAITDLVRCTITYQTLPEVAEFFDAVRGRSDMMGGIGMLRIRRVKNRLDPEFSDPSGYRDLAILVEVGWLEREGTIEFVPVKDWASSATSRLICEIQVHLAAVYAVKIGGSHEKYVQYRDMLAS